ncbi:MAG: hypothetical protein JWM10_1799 [Myxococcaceae bacterium]|nr:hypothetical protein [Myxococcaceae bacterium]
MRKLTALAFVVALAGLAAPASPAHAQIDPNVRSYGVYQRDQLVAEIYREDAGPSRYTEHWVLSPAYVYPSDANGVTTVIRSSGRAYDGLADFFARVPWSPGSRHVEATCDDGDALPARR